jgi:hypothetical protein
LKTLYNLGILSGFILFVQNISTGEGEVGEGRMRRGGLGGEQGEGRRGEEGRGVGGERGVGRRGSGEEGRSGGGAG